MKVASVWMIKMRLSYLHIVQKYIDFPSRTRRCSTFSIPLNTAFYFKVRLSPQ